jgi:hypothetical protein
MSDYRIVACQTLFEISRLRIVTDTVEHDRRRRDWPCQEGPASGEVLQMILRGEIVDGSLQLGLLLAAHKGLIG